jgi:myo-inositol-1(or 4)-monophosphatase
MHAWDVAAANLICTEAGAVTSDLDGSHFSITSRRLLVASPGVHGAVRDILVEGGAPVAGSRSDLT